GHGAFGTFGASHGGDELFGGAVKQRAGGFAFAGQQQGFSLSIGLWRALSDLFQGFVQSLLHGGFIVLAVVHQAQAQGLGSVEAGGGQGQAAGLGQADAVHHEGRDLRREDTQRGFRQAELGAGGSDGHVGDAGQTEAAAEHGAFQHRYQYLRGGLGFFQQRTEGAVQFAVGVAALGAGAGHVLDVAAGAEVATGAAQNE